MLKNYLIIALRNLWKNKAFSIINVMGLAIGVAACLMILQYVKYQLSYDNFNADGDQIYRVINDYFEYDQLHSSNALSVGGAGTLIQNEIPEVKAMARIHPFYGEGLVTNDSINGTIKIVASEGTMYFADSTFFKVFALPILKGGLSEVQNPDAIFISASTATKLFDTSEAVGKWINIRKQGTNLSFFVAGVFEDIPDNSHLQIDYLFSLATQGDWFVDDFGWSEFYTYVKLYEDQDPTTVADKITAVVANRKEIDPNYKDTFSRFFLQPVNQIHLNNNLSGEPSETVNAKIITLLIFASFFILIIAYINYINLSISQSLTRAKEIGVRKVTGAAKGQLVKQFLLEAMVVNLGALGTGVLIIQLFAPYFNQLMGVPLPSLFSNWFGPLALVSMLSFGTLLSGLYPAFVISSFKPITVLKGKIMSISQKYGLRKSLVVIQFSATLLLIIGSYAIYSQIQFMRGQDLGFDLEQTLVLKRPIVADSTYSSRLNSFRQASLQLAFVQDLSAATSIPGRIVGWYTDGVQRITNPDNLLSARMQSVDYSYVNTFQLKMIAGRNFDQRLDENQNVMMLNETAVRRYGFENPEDAVGARMIRERKETYTVIGVLADYHHESLKRNYEPTVFFLNVRSPNYVALKLRTKDIPASLASIGGIWKQHFGDNPFTYFFLDDYFNQQYQADVRFGKVIGLFAVLAILVACLGLLALAASVVQQRTKEVGIRKVLGATVANILVLLSVDLVRLILVAHVIALPLVYLFLKDWLTGYAFRMDITIWLFVIPGLLVFLIALGTVGIKSLQAALTNPVDSLKYE